MGVLVGWWGWGEWGWGGGGGGGGGGGVWRWGWWWDSTRRAFYQSAHYKEVDRPKARIVFHTYYNGVLLTLRSKQFSG